MEIPTELQQAIELARSEVDKHEYIGPFYRNEVYKAFDDNNKSIGYKARTWLAILVAWYSFAKWQQYFPIAKTQSETNRPEHWLYLAKGIVQEKIVIVDAEQKVKQVSQALKKARKQNKSWEGSYSLTAATAAFVALCVALGRDPYEGRSFRPSDNDNNVDEFNHAQNSLWDATFYAYEGYAMQQQDFDDDASTEFWEWWLSEAIPQSWDRANQRINTSDFDIY